jgi:hypothetical protein
MAHDHRVASEVLRRPCVGRSPAATWRPSSGLRNSRRDARPPKNIIDKIPRQIPISHQMRGEAINGHIMPIVQRPHRLRGHLRGGDHLVGTSGIRLSERGSIERSLSRASFGCHCASGVRWQRGLRRLSPGRSGLVADLATQVRHAGRN